MINALNLYSRSWVLEIVPGKDPEDWLGENIDITTLTGSDIMILVQNLEPTSSFERIHILMIADKAEDLKPPARRFEETLIRSFNETPEFVVLHVGKHMHSFFVSCEDITDVLEVDIKGLLKHAFSWLIHNNPEESSFKTFT